MSYLLALRELIGSRKVIHPAARIIIENDRGEILLLRRTGNNRWGLIAGGFEEGELLDRSGEAKELKFFGLAELPDLAPNEAPALNGGCSGAKMGGSF